VRDPIRVRSGHLVVTDDAGREHVLDFDGAEFATTTTDIVAEPVTFTSMARLLEEIGPPPVTRFDPFVVDIRPIVFEVPPPKPVEFSFAGVIMAGSLMANPLAFLTLDEPPSVTLTATWREPRNPPIGALRCWAARTSATPWRRRSISSWRHAWRRDVADRETALTLPRATIRPGPGDTLTVESSAPVDYDIFVGGRHA
jgi:hypothetical protein